MRGRTRGHCATRQHDDDFAPETRSADAVEQTINDVRKPVNSHNFQRCQPPRVSSSCISGRRFGRVPWWRRRRRSLSPASSSCPFSSSVAVRSHGVVHERSSRGLRRYWRRGSQRGGTTTGRHSVSERHAPASRRYANGSRIALQCRCTSTSTTRAG